MHSRRPETYCIVTGKAKHTKPSHFLQCSPPSTAENRMCPSFEGTSIVSKRTLFVALLNSCGLNQSSLPFCKWNRRHRRNRLLFAAPVHYSIVWILSFPLWSPSAHIISPRFKAMSHLKFICSHVYNLLSLSPALRHQLLSWSAGLNSWPEFRAELNFRNKVSFNWT